MTLLDRKSIDVNGKIIRFDINICQIEQYKDFFVVLIRDRREIPNNIIAYDYKGEELWKINDIVCAKTSRGYERIEKKSENILIAYYELGIIFEVDIYEKRIVKKIYLR